MPKLLKFALKHRKMKSGKTLQGNILRIQELQVGYRFVQATVRNDLNETI